MLKGLDPLLSPQLLSVLREMGHRHDIAIVDANFPCENGSLVIRADGSSATDILQAVLSVLPLERGEPACAWRMIMDGDRENIAPVFLDFAKIVSDFEPGVELEPIDPDDFKRRAQAAYAVVITGERRLYGNILLRKGVVPDGV